MFVVSNATYFVNSLIWLAIVSITVVGIPWAEVGAEWAVLATWYGTEGASSCILSARSANLSSGRSDWEARIVWILLGNRLDHNVFTKSSGTDDPARLLKCLKNWDGLRSPNSSCINDCFTFSSWDADNRLINSVFNLLYFSSVGGLVIYLRYVSVLQNGEDGIKLCGVRFDIRQHDLAFHLREP